MFEQLPIWEPRPVEHYQIHYGGVWQRAFIHSGIARYAGAVLRSGVWAMRQEEADRQAALPEPTVRTVIHVGTVTDPSWTEAVESIRRTSRGLAFADAMARRPVVSNDMAVAA